MWSFKYPDQLLHRTTEKEWFPRSSDYQESRLNALEREEEAHQNRIKKIANAKAKQPIGVLSTNKTKAGSAASTTAANETVNTQVDMSVIEPQPRPRIWNNLLSSLSSPPHTPRSEAQSSMMMMDDTSMADSPSVTFSP